MKKLIILTIAMLLPALTASAQTTSLSGGQIVGIVLAINEAEVEAGNLVRSTSTNPQVKMFGHRLVGEHNGSTWLLTDLAKKEGISPQDSPISESLKADAKKHFSKLKGLQGAALNVAYIDHEVTQHQQVLDLFDKNLIPNAKNEELQSLLSVIRSWLAGHLEHAKMIQTSLGKK